jgi:hypothetical protein
MNTRLVFVLGVTAGSMLTLLALAHPEQVAHAAAAPSMGSIEIDEGAAHYTCSAASAEVIDASSSAPRLVLSASCPNGKRLSLVAWPTRLPGSARVSSVRFLDVASGEEWGSSDASLEVAKFEQVGSEVGGHFDATMGARLNRDPVHVHAVFRAARAADRSSP